MLIASTHVHHLHPQSSHTYMQRTFQRLSQGRKGSFFLHGNERYNFICVQLLLYECECVCYKSDSSIIT